jgi:hypothetical protein
MTRRNKCRKIVTTMTILDHEFGDVDDGDDDDDEGG